LDHGRHRTAQPGRLEFVRCFTGATWDHVLVLVAGALLSPGRRTVSAALRVLDQSASFAVYHRVLSTARWSARRRAHRLLHLLVAAFVRDGPVVIGLDDTIERRWGTKIKARGIYREGGSQVSPSLLPYRRVASVACGTGSKPVRSSHGHFVKASGLRWLCVMLLAPIAWAGCVWALPFLTILAPSERSAQKQGRRHKKLTDCQALLQTARWLPGSSRSPTAASRSSSCCAPSARTWTSSPGCASMPACMNRPHPAALGTRAAPASKLPTLTERVADPTTAWQRVVIQGWYGSIGLMSPPRCGITPADGC
jgi:DDE superfamily endonuclease